VPSLRFLCVTSSVDGSVSFFYSEPMIL
jgi:hypothetical protein